MKTPSRKLARSLSANQCCHLSPTGRRCRSARSSPTSCLCPRHRTMEQTARPADLVPELAARLTDIRESLQSVEGVRNSLAELYILLAQNRVSARRAAVLAQITRLLLRLLPDEEDAAARKPEVQFVFDRAPKPKVEAASPLSDESQRTERCPGAVYAVRTWHDASSKNLTDSERTAIENFQAIST
jgi:hypothetical protein